MHPAPHHFVMGVILLIFGRRLFWLFIAAVGFGAGFEFSRLYLGIQPVWALWAIGLVTGFGGALLALFFQRLAIGLGGFAAGGYIAFYLTSLLATAPPFWIYLIGGVIGAILMYFLFDWALIAISSVAGATLIVQSIQWEPLYKALLYGVLIVVGFVLQALWMRLRTLKARRRNAAFNR
jgi:hypothetical protein